MRTASSIPFRAEPTAVPGLLVLTMKQAVDARGTVREFFRTSALADLGVRAGPWQQITLTSTAPGVIRGLHGEQVTKLVTVAAGAAFGVYADARPGSPARGRVVTVELRPGTQVLVPPGVCSGLQATGPEPAEYLYAADREWQPGAPHIGVHPLDPALGVRWPVPVAADDATRLSVRDASQPTFAEALMSQSRGAGSSV
ncbi:dTDP-4-dehydrorhamnose 3,5-epimerase family protein [Actinoplanes sp. N902-109]|uniref:dTDP-4-dehydrorhamnose 3,5-epimerase family protein n=1 Tax=Actinoplanes sp. (strain N902-109) TaxID=649831 RepID=UPI000329616C|nr:dTDP-4-dehydrorhamnose 3,5-epimerase [Actinoplanes sp. N902-109]AGL16738.1 dTDP-4-dehydrorhamnose 35-epimerase related protein [Actinoplanes sp. N902-109]